MPPFRAQTPLKDAKPASQAGARILLLCDAHGATQTISFHRPLAGLISSGQCRIEAIDEAQLAKAGPRGLRELWAALEPTVLVLSRYAGGKEAAAIELARHAGIRVVYHIDDNLLAVPPELGPQKFARYNAPERLEALIAAMRAADVVYASTPELKRQVGEREPGLRLVAGDIYCALEPRILGASGRGAPMTVGYMGTSGHGADLDMVVPALVSLMDRNPALRFETFGTIKMPAALTRFGERVAHHQGLADYDAFLGRLAGLGWHVGLAPIIDTPFNRCKADTKWVEYTAAGIAVAASDLPVYSRACTDGGGLLVETNDWEAAIDSLIASDQLRTSMIGVAQDRLTRNYAPARLLNQVQHVLAGGK